MKYPFQQRGTKAYSQGCTANNSDFYRFLYSLSTFLWSYKQSLFTLYLILLDNFFAFSLYFHCLYIIYSLLSPFLDPWETNTCISIYFVVQSLSYVLLFCDSLDCSPPVSFVHGISQARTLELVAISSSRGSSQPKDQICVSCISCIGRQILLPLSHLGSSFFKKLS